MQFFSTCAVSVATPNVARRTTWLAGRNIKCSPPSRAAMATGAGREADMAGGWRLVKSRRGPRRPALAAPAFKPAPIPRWLVGRCCRCLHRGHRAESCRDPIRCSRCLQNGHKSRGCQNLWKPLSSLDSLAVPPPPLPRPTTAVVGASRLGRGWEAPRPLLPPATPRTNMARPGGLATAW